MRRHVRLRGFLAWHRCDASMAIHMLGGEDWALMNHSELRQERGNISIIEDKAFRHRSVQHSRKRAVGTGALYKYV